MLTSENSYDQFHLDEPWDSEHNLALVKSMPDVFVSPERTLPPGQTCYVLPHGKGLMFEGANALRFNALLDGSSNTIMIVEAAPETAVIWTKPADWEVDLADPKKGLFVPPAAGASATGANAAFADASVQNLSASISPDDLKAILTRAGGEPVEMPEDE